MKKIGVVLLTVYVTIVTIGCGVFGTLFFLGGGSLNNLTYAEAKTLVHKVYDTQVTNLTSHSATSQEYVDYTEDDFDYTLFQMPFAAYQACLTNFEKALSSNLATDVWHGQPRDYGLTFVDENVFRMTIKGQTVAIEVGQPTDAQNIQDGTNTVHPGENYICQYFEVTKKSETSWKVDWYNRYYFTIENSSSQGGYHFAFWHFVFEAEDSKVFSVNFEAATTNLKVLKETLTDNDIYSYLEYDCNLKTKKVMSEYGPQELLETTDGSFPEYTQGLSKAETISRGKKMNDDQKKVMGLYLDDEYFS